MPVLPPPAASIFPIGTGYGMSWTTEQRTTPAYVPDSQSTAYTGGLLDLLQAARLTSLNLLRVAVETDRVFAEATRAQLNGLIVDMQSKGLLT